VTPDDAFLQSIIENPEDDTPRLVYADWLDEHGQPERAEFIRVQCELDKTGEDDPRRQGLKEREQGLLQEHRKRWVEPLNPLVLWAGFCRGFVEEVDIQAETFLARADTLFRLAPVRSLLLSEPGDGHMADLAASPWLGRLASLDLRPSGDSLSDEGARALAGSRHLANLRALHLAGTGPAGVHTLLASPALPRLEVLRLEGCDLADCDAEALLEGWRLVSLKELSFCGTCISVEGLARSPHLASLATLEVSDDDLRFRDEDVRALAHCEHLSALTSLRLKKDDIGEAGAKLLARSAVLGSLTSLCLRENQVKPAGVQALASSPCLGSLTTLDLSWNGIGDAGAEALAASLSLPHLGKLDLGWNGIRDAGARALAGSRRTAGLTKLDLSKNYLSETTRQALREQFGHRICF
jgi:uncharacterized protein (TIGR02996 family)